MAWTPIETVNIGDTVDTPQGSGKVKRISQAQKTAHVEIGTDTIEVPLEQVKQQGAKGAPAGQPQDGDFKPGDTVQAKGSKTPLTVTKVQERGIWAQPKTGGAQKRYRRDQLSKQGAPTGDAGDGAEPNEHDFKVGDLIKGKAFTPYSITTDEATMEVKSVNGDKLGIKILKHKTKQGQVGNTYTVNAAHMVKIGDAKKDEPKDEPFKVGDQVRLKKGSKYYGQFEGVGAITEVTDDETLPYNVTSDSGYTNNYGAKDLEKVPKEPQVGDYVEVTNSGHVYTSFENMASKLNATSWKEGNTAQNGDQGTVKAIDTGYDRVTLVERDNGNQFLIGLKGLKVIDGAAKDVQPNEPNEPNEKETDKVKETGDGLAELLQLKQYMEKKIDDSVTDELKDLKEAVVANQKLEITIGDKTTVLKGKRHAQLDTLITYSGLRLATLMVGMAGTGKTHAAEQVAEALALPFYAMSVGAQTSKSDIIGYMDATGNYVKTFFRDAYEHGGIFLMDEIDAGNANVLIQVNAALSNGLCAFPDRMVHKHPDFVFIASANTYGNGASRQYVGRNQLDAATLDRFAILDWKIDDSLEETLAVGNYGAAWYKTVRAARDYVADKGIRALISPRATQKGSQLLAAGIHVSEAINATLLGSVPEDKKADVIMVATRVFDDAAKAVPSRIGELIREEPVEEVMPF